MLLRTKEDWTVWKQSAESAKYAVSGSPDSFPCFLDAWLDHLPNKDTYHCTFVSVEDIKDFQERLTHAD